MGDCVKQVEVQVTVCKYRKGPLPWQSYAVTLTSSLISMLYIEHNKSRGNLCFYKKIKMSKAKEVPTWIK